MEELEMKILPGTLRPPPIPPPCQDAERQLGLPVTRSPGSGARGDLGGGGLDRGGQIKFGVTMAIVAGCSVGSAVITAWLIFHLMRYMNY